MMLDKWSLTFHEHGIIDLCLEIYCMIKMSCTATIGTASGDTLLLLVKHAELIINKVTEFAASLFFLRFKSFWCHFSFSFCLFSFLCHLKFIKIMLLEVKNLFSHYT